MQCSATQYWYQTSWKLDSVRELSLQYLRVLKITQRLSFLSDTPNNRNWAPQEARNNNYYNFNQHELLNYEERREHVDSNESGYC